MWYLVVSISDLCPFSYIFGSSANDFFMFTSNWEISFLNAFQAAIVLRCIQHLGLTVYACMHFDSDDEKDEKKSYSGL